MIDYIIVRQRDLQIVCITRALRGAECLTDHRLIRAVLNLHIAPAQLKRPKTIRSAFDIAKLKKGFLCERFQDTLDYTIQNATLAEDSTEKWGHFKNVVIETAKSVLGPNNQYTRTGSTTTTNKSHSYFRRKTTPSALGRRTIARRQKETLQALERAGTEKAAGDERYLVGQESRKVQMYADTRNSKKFCRALKAIYGPSKSGSTPLQSADASTLIKSVSCSILMLCPNNR